MKNRLLNTVKNWLQSSCEDNYYSTNKDFAKDCLCGERDIFEAATGRDLFVLVEYAPEELTGKKDDYGISLDLLWAEEQVADIFERA